MIYDVTIAGRTRSVSIERNKDCWQIRVDEGPAQHVDARAPQPGVLSMVLGHRSCEAGLALRDQGWEVDLFGRTHYCEVIDPRKAALKLGGGAAEGTLTSSMPGRVIRVMVAPGAQVFAGDPLLVVEAMKMENEIRASIDGVIAEIAVTAGQVLESGARLLRIEPAVAAEET